MLQWGRGVAVAVIDVAASGDRADLGFQCGRGVAVAVMIVDNPMP